MAEAVAPGSGKERPIGFLGLMRNRNYGLLWWGQLVSELGNRFHWVAVSLWVYSATGSATAVSFAVSSMFIGGLFVGLWAGVIVDRFDRKKILIASDLVRGVLVALIPGLMKSNIWLVYADLALISVATAFFRPAMFAVVPQVVNRRDLLTGNSFLTAMDTGMEIAGPALAGFLALKYQYAFLLYVDAVSFVVSALCILGMSIGGTVRGVRERLRLNSIWSDVREGLRYIRRDNLQWGLFVLIFPAFIVGSGLNALQTPLAKGIVHVTDAEFGIFQGVWGFGFLVASLVLGWFGSRVRKSALIIGGFFLVFAATAVMGTSLTLDALLATGFAVGFANTLHYVGLSTVLMEHTPQGVIGRVISTRQLALGSVRVVSPLVFGAFADVAGVRSAIILMAGAGAVGTLAVLSANPTVRKFDLANGAAEKSLPDLLSLSGRIDPALEEAPQRRLNLITIGMVVIGWVYFYRLVPYHAVGFLGVVSIAAWVGSTIRRKGWIP